MSTRKRLATMAVITALGIAAWRIETPAAAPPASAVQLVPQGQRLTGKPGEKGATFYWLEGRTTKLTTRFANAVAIAERGPDGDLNTRLLDTDGNEVARLKIDRIDETAHVLQYMAGSGKTISALGQVGTRPTLDWANRQAYLLWHDRADAAQALEWQRGFIRPAGATSHDVQRDIVELRTEWADGLSAATTHRMKQRVEYQKGRIGSGEVVVGRLQQDGVDIGRGNWFPAQKVFTWSLPGMTEGFLDSERLAAVGGWVFEPDDEWMNLQLIAFAHFKRLIDERGYVARRGGSGGPLARLLSFIEPTLSANEPGCDGLHWLDGTTFRYCCDVHDWCYSKNGCSSTSWWQWWSSWRCDACNLWVVACFYDELYSPMTQI